MMERPAHHPTLAPSSFPAIAACACYQSSGDSSEAADSGTRQHAALAEMLNNDLLSPLEPDESDQVLWAYNEIKALTAGGELVVEEEVEVLGDDFNTVTYGTLDCACGRDVFDYKSVEKRDYWLQMAVYALGWMQRTGMGSCRCVILYGRYRQTEERTFTLAEATRIVNEIVTRRNDPNAKPEICAYCSWCANVGHCPAVVKTAVAVADHYDPASPTLGIETWHPSEVTDPRQMGQMMDIARVVECWAESVKFHARKRMVEDGWSVPGYELAKRSGKTIKDVNAVYAASGLTPSDFLACCEVQTGKLEKRFAEAAGLSLAKAKKELWARCPEAVELKPDTKYVKKTKDDADAES
jgi:hypothetical protein